MKAQGILLKNQSLKTYTSWRIGGPAEQVYSPVDLTDLVHFIQSLSPEEPLTWLGLGSNVLIKDKGVSGTVIMTQGRLNKMSLISPSTVRVEAGVACPVFARFCARQSLVNTEFLAGIPGTIGGALMMNAGCHGGEIWDHIIAVEMLDYQGQIHIRKPQDFTINYREVRFSQPKEWFVAAHFLLAEGNSEEALLNIRNLLEYRAKTQPTNQPSCGSVFRNPPGDYAARLIESLGLKGQACGGAMVSSKHANFIVNTGNATAEDVEALIRDIQEKIFCAYKIELKLEVKILGN